MRVSCDGRLCIPPAHGVLPGFSVQTIASEPITPSSSLLCEEGSLVVILLLLQSSPASPSHPSRSPPPPACPREVLGVPISSLWSGWWSWRSGSHGRVCLGKSQGCSRTEPAGPPGYQVWPFSFSGEEGVGPEEADWAEHSQIQEPPASKKDHSKLYLLGSSFPDF